MVELDPKLPKVGDPDYDNALHTRLQQLFAQHAAEINRKLDSVYNDPVYWMGRNRHNGPDGSGSGFSSPLTTKGDLLTEDVTGAIRLAVGTDNQVLTADSAQAAGIKWATPAAGFTDPTTTKGDIIVHGASTTRLAVGTDNQVLTADSAQAAGIKWATPASGFADPTTTKGDLIVHGASTTRIAVGSDGQVLTADSAQVAGIKWATATSPALVLLEQHTASASSSLAFTSWYSSTYDDYLIEIVSFINGSAAIPRIRCSTDGGSTYDSGNNYDWVHGFSYSGSASKINAATTNCIALRDSNTTLATAGSWNGFFRLFNPGSTSLHKVFLGEHVVDDGSVGLIFFHGGGKYKSTSAVNALQFDCSAGTITSGTVRIYGILK